MLPCFFPWIVGMPITVSTTMSWRSVSSSVAMLGLSMALTSSLFTSRSFVSFSLRSCGGRRRSGDRREWRRREGCLRRVLLTRRRIDLIVYWHTELLIWLCSHISDNYFDWLTTHRTTNPLSRPHRRNASHTWRIDYLYCTGGMQAERGVPNQQSPLCLIASTHLHVSFHIVEVAPNSKGSTTTVTNRSSECSGVFGMARWRGRMWIIGWHLTCKSLQPI